MRRHVVADRLIVSLRRKRSRLREHQIVEPFEWREGDRLDISEGRAVSLGFDASGNGHAALFEIADDNSLLDELPSQIGIKAVQLGFDDKVRCLVEEEKDVLLPRFAEIYVSWLNAER